MFMAFDTERESEREILSLLCSMVEYSPAEDICFFFLFLLPPSIVLVKQVGVLPVSILEAQNITIRFKSIEYNYSYRFCSRSQFGPNECI